MSQPMIDLEIRDYYKERFIRKEDVKPEDVTMAVLNIYQSEFGHWFEDEAYEGLVNDVAGLCEKHHGEAQNYDALVDKVLSELRRDVPSIDEQIRLSDNGVQPAAGS